MGDTGSKLSWRSFVVQSFKSGWNWSNRWLSYSFNILSILVLVSGAGRGVVLAARHRHSMTWWVVAAVGIVLVGMSFFYGCYAEWKKAEEGRLTALRERDNLASEHQSLIAEPSNTVTYAISGSLTGGAGGSGYNAGGGGGVAVGPNSYAAGGEGGKGTSLLDALAKVALPISIPLAAFIRIAGFDPFGDELNQTFGAGGSGGGSQGSTGGTGNDGENGLAIIAFFGDSAEVLPVVWVSSEPGEYEVTKPDDPRYKWVSILVVGGGGGGSSGGVFPATEIPITP